MSDLPDTPKAERVQEPSHWRSVFATRRRRWVVGIVVVNLLALVVLAGVGSAHSNDCGGFSGYSGGFEPCHSDIGVTLVAIPRSVNVGNQLVYLATVKNHGPDRAFESEMTIRLPAGVAVSWALTSQHDYCEYEHYFVECYIYDLQRGQAAAATIVIRPFVAGTMRTTAAVETFGIDPNPNNNKAVVVVTVRP
jgi:hypothetical protein